MMIDDCREFLLELEKRDRLKKIDVPVDKDWEISCIARHAMKLPTKERSAILFENVRGFKYPVLINAFASHEMYAIGMESTIEGIHELWHSALQKPLEPELVNSASCKENVLLGDKVDLNIFPHIISTPKKDAGPYITAGCVVTKDPETGGRNVGIYRCMIKSKNKLGIHMAPANHGNIIYSKYEERDKPMEVAIVIGTPPTVTMAAVARVPFGVDELAVSGGLGKSPLKVVKCETVNLEVPANSEIVIEGEIPPKLKEPEGPFGEFFGYMGEEIMSPVVNVKGITYRNDPIYQVLLQQTSPNEGNILKDVAMEAILTWTFKIIGIPRVTGIHIGETSAGESVVVGIKKIYPGHVLAVAQACWAAYPLAFKQIIVVDGDCDIFDPADVEWRIATCVQPDRDIYIVPNFAGSALDPSIPKERQGQGSKVCIDATRKFKYPKVALPPKELLHKVKQQWGSYGLPEFS